MREARRSIYVVRMSGDRCCTAVKRLADLTDDNKAINGSFTQRPKNFLPRRRMGGRGSPKLPRNQPPGIDRTIAFRWKDLSEPDLEPRQT
jgi:hypothetical protein